MMYAVRKVLSRHAMFGTPDPIGTTRRDIQRELGHRLVELLEDGKCIGTLKYTRTEDFENIYLTASVDTWTQRIEVVKVLDDDLALKIWNGFSFCPYCGCENVKEDEFHSGTCENCGGRLARR